MPQGGVSRQAPQAGGGCVLRELDELPSVGGPTRATAAFRVYCGQRMPTFYARFVENSKRWPRNIAVDVQKPEGLESYTYAQLRTMAEAFGAWLVANAMPPGER